MSSILKALKKLEEETTLSEKEGKPFTGVTPSVKRGPSLSLTVSFLKDALKLTTFFLSVAFVFWLVIHFNSDEPESISESVAPPLAPSPLPEPTTIMESEEKKTLLPPFVPPPERARTPEIVAPQKSPALVQEKSDQEETAGTEDPPPRADESALDPSEERTESMEQIEDPSWLTLQAISWSGDPKKRIAVINNAIVKQGWPVERGKVSVIEKDYVIIKSGEKEWLLPFGRK